MKPKRIILIRHGKSEGNTNKDIYARKPDYTVELTRLGKAQAKQAGRKLKRLINDDSVCFYISPFWRTRSTFEEIAKSIDKQYTAEYKEEPRIREQEWGHLRELEVNEALNEARDAYGTFYFRIPDGESAADVYDRVSDFMGTLDRDFKKDNFPANAVLITHGMTMRIFLMRWFHWTVEEFEKVANPDNCKAIVLELKKDGKYKLKNKLKKHTVRHNFQRPIRLK